MADWRLPFSVPMLAQVLHVDGQGVDGEGATMLPDGGGNRTLHLTSSESNRLRTYIMRPPGPATSFLTS